MARPSTAATRNLTLTEELERLEQSITLTPQGTHSNLPNEEHAFAKHFTRNRSQLQSRPPDSYNQYPAYRRAICEAFGECVGRIEGQTKRSQFLL